MADEETPRHDFTLTKHKAFRRVIRLKNPDGTPQNLTGSTFKWVVKPWDDDEFTIDVDGDDDQLLIVDAVNSKITIYISDENIDAFTWRGADYRFQQYDSLGDGKPRFVGEMRFERAGA
jgi:hypothetical protein